MQIKYNNKRIEKVCTKASVSDKLYGKDMSVKIQQRITQIKAADSVEQMIKDGIGRCHLLKGDRKNQYAVDLIHPKRLIFVKKGDEIQIAVITEITDYH